MSFLRLNALRSLLGFLLIFSASCAGWSQTGSASFGTVSLDQGGGSQTVTLTFANAGTAASLEALTLGTQNQDFAIASGGSCEEGQSYLAGATCTEVVTFTPKAAGLRRGAVVIADGSGDQLAVAYVWGVGSGPQAGLRAIAPPVSYAGIGISVDKAMAVDGAGDLFVASENTTTAKEAVYEVPSGCSEAACMKQLPGTFGAVWGMAVDGAGNLWVGDVAANGTITEILATGGYSTSKSYSGTFGNQIGVAVDGSGNVMFISASASSSTSVMELTSASSYKTVKTLASGINVPGGIAVDSSGDVFYVDTDVEGIQELVAVNGTLPATPTVQTVGSGLRVPLYIAIDGSDSLFVTTEAGFIDEVSPAGGYSTFTTYSNQFATPSGIAIDASGDLFVSVLVAGLNNNLEPIETGTPFEIPRTAAAALTFSTPTAPGEVDSADGVETVSLENTGNQALGLANLNISNSNFSFVNSTTCSTSTVLAAGANCTLGMQFNPTATGNPVTATVTLTDNSQNATAGGQAITLSGTSLYTPTISVAGPIVIAVSQSLPMTITIHGASAGPTPTGTVQVTGDGYLGSAVALSNGQATVTIPAGTLTAGAASLLIVYQPDTAGALNYLPVQGHDPVTVTQTLENQPQVQVLPALGSISVGQALTVQVNVLEVNGSPLPTGTVTLFAGSYTSAAVALSGASASVTVPANSLPLGIDEVIAVYAPDAASASIYLGANGGALVDVSAAPLPAGAAPVAFSSLGIGTASAVTPVTLVFPMGGTPASVVATTQGAPGLDFALAAGGSCGAGVYVAPGASCTANVVFTPAYPGLRNGAVTALDSNGVALAMTYVYGGGTGAQLAIESIPNYDFLGATANAQMFPTITTQLSSGYSWPRVTVDGAGNVYVADEGNSRIQKIPAGCTSNSCAITITTGILYPAGMTVDGAGNIFATELGFNDVKEIPLGCQSISCTVTVGAGFSQPNGVAVDASGNVFVADTGNGAIKEVVAAGGYATINTLATGLDSPWSVAVDSSGNLFVAQGGDQCQVWIPGSCSSINTSIVEITAASGYKTVNTLIGNNELGKPLGVTIDGSGNVYEADYGDACSYEVLAGASYQSSQGWCLNASIWVLDGAIALGRENNGSIAWGDVNTGDVSLTQFNQQPSIVFKTAVLNGTSDFADGVQLTYLLNNGNAPLALSGIALSDPSFHFDSATTTCATSKPLAAGSSCLVGVDFAPQVYGPISATLTLTSNNMNQAGATLVIPISAVALPPTPVILTTPPNPTTATSAAFTFSDTQTPVTFVCSIDSLPFSACASPYTYSALSGGQHTFQVRAEDAKGNLGPAAAYIWTVNSVGPPAPVIISGPNSVSLTPAAAFTFTDSRSGVSFQCSLDGAAFAPCTSGVSYTVTGSSGYGVLIHHTFAVEAEDASSNVSPEATYTWSYVATPGYGEGSAANFGAVPVGQTSAPLTVTFNITVASANHPTETVASIAVYALGIAGSQEFSVTNGGTCTVGDSVTLGTSCALSAAFTPAYPGQRKGAAALLDANGVMLGLAYLQGTGTAPQLTFTPYSTESYNILPPQNNSNPGKDLEAPATSVTLDGAGNLYVSDALVESADGTVIVSTGDIWKFAPGCNSSSCNTLFATNGRSGSSVPNGGVLLPLGIDVDGAGLLWVSNGELGPRLISLNAGLASPLCTYGQDFGQTDGVAVDGAGLAWMVENGGVYVCNTLVGAFSLSSTTPAITVDPQGNIFVADEGNNAVGEVLASSNYTIARTVGSGFSKPQGIASDTNGNIYVADTGNNAIKEMTAASGYTQIVTVATFSPGTVTPGNMAFDALGNLYVVNYGAVTNQAIKIDLADVPALAFATSTQVGSTDSADGTLTATVKNNGNEPLAISGLTIAGNSFQLDASTTTCAVATTVNAGSSCTIGVIFTPQASGALTGSVTLTDNALNAAGSTHVFALSGTGVTAPATVRPTVTVTPANASVTTAQSDVVTISVSAPSGNPTPTGSVTLSGGNYTSASVALASGSASVTIPAGALALGSNTVNAIYAPDTASNSTYGAATASASITVTSVPKSTPTVGVTPALLDVSTTQSLQVAIAVTAGAGNPTPTGSVTLSGGNYASLAATLANGSASIAIPSGYLPSGMVTLTANYTPDAAGSPNFNSASGTGQVDVEAAPLVTPGVTVTPASSSVTSTQPLRVTIAVSGGSGNPVATGSIVLSTGSYSSTAAPISQGSVILTVPAGTLGGGSNTLSAVYTPDKASALTYNSATGTASVTAPATGQTITFAQPASPVTYASGLTISLSATGGASGNPVIFSIDGSSTGTGSISGSTLAVGSAGTFVIDANQAGNNNYPAASQVQRTVVVTQIAQAITFAQPTSPVIYSQGLTIPLTASGGASGNPVVFNIDASSTGTGSISGSTLSVASIGTFVIDANHVASTDYSAAPQVQRTVLVNALTAQTITFAQPTSPVTYSPGLTVSLSAAGGASGNPVVFNIDASSTAAGSISGSTLTATSAGTFVIDANQSGNSSYSAALQVQRTVVVSPAPQAINFTQPATPETYSAGLTIPLSAIGGASGNPVVFNIDASSTATGSVSGSTLTVAAAGTLVIDANQAGNVDYLAAPQVQRTVVVNALPSDFALSIAPAALSIAPGGSGSITVTVASVSGSFSNPVNLSLSGLPAGFTGTFSSSSITPGSTSATSQLTIADSNTATLSMSGDWPLAVPALALLVLLPLRPSRRMRTGRLLVVLVGLLSLTGLTALSGCGGGFGLVPPPTTSTLTITATSGTDTHSTTVQLTVQ